MVQVSEDMFGLEPTFEHLNVLACKMELEFIPIWFQLSRIRSENEESVLIVNDSLTRAEDFDPLVDDKGAEIVGAEVDTNRHFNEEAEEACVQSCESAGMKG